jgi:NitT/TauT family transport system permease protein
MESSLSFDAAAEARPPAPDRDSGEADDRQVRRVPLSLATRLRRTVAPRERAWQVLILLVVLGVWQFLGARSDSFVFAPPTRVAHTAVTMIGSGELGHAVADSLADLFLGFAAAVTVGLLLGFAMGAYETLGRALSPFIAGLYAVPQVAVVPVMVAWTGIGLVSRVLVIFTFAVFEPLYVARAGIRGIDRSLYEAARTFGATPWQLFHRVSLPATLPFVFVGVRMAAVRAVKGMVVAQVLISSFALGGLITASANGFRIDKVLVVAVTLALIAVALSAAVGVIERALLRGRP